MAVPVALSEIFRHSYIYLRTLEAIGQYVYEQGFSPRAVNPDDLFALNA